MEAVGGSSMLRPTAGPNAWVNRRVGADRGRGADNVEAYGKANSSAMLGLMPDRGCLDNNGVYAKVKADETPSGKGAAQPIPC